MNFKPTSQANNGNYKTKFFVSSILCLIVSACATLPQPDNINNVCHIFKQYPRWRRDALYVERRWHVPVAVQMAIVHQESKFNAKAKPNRTKLLRIIPWKRPSTAYGYAQALDGTWSIYQKQRGGMWASRDNFGQGVDFIGWYANIAYKRAGISRNDPYNLYLAYHEGIGGYLRRTYLKKKWLMRVANKVKNRAKLYHAQLKLCGMI